VVAEAYAAARERLIELRRSLGVSSADVDTLLADSMVREAARLRSSPEGGPNEDVLGLYRDSVAQFGPLYDELSK
jgi:hypothetical protein